MPSGETKFFVSYAREDKAFALKLATDLRAAGAKSDCFLALGSSLLVNPAAALAGLAKRCGAALIVITLGDTPYDDVADVVIHGPLAETLPRITALVLDRE